MQHRNYAPYIRWGGGTYLSHSPSIPNFYALSKEHASKTTGLTEPLPVESGIKGKSLTHSSLHSLTRNTGISLFPHLNWKSEPIVSLEKKKKQNHYLLGDCSCQVPTSTIPRHSNAPWVHRILGQHPPLEEVFDHTVYILIWYREVVSRGEAVPGGTD